MLLKLSLGTSHFSQKQVCELGNSVFRTLNIEFFLHQGMHIAQAFPNLQRFVLSQFFRKLSRNLDFQVFLLQGFFMLLISTSAITAFADSFGKLGLLEAAGAVVWLTGFFFESVGDLELSRFVKNPANKGKLMTGGLWRYTRHPNYFGEVTQWWGIFLVVLSSPYGFLAIISPLTITFLILKVSGIPMLEKKYEGRADFAQYKRKTSAFFPLPPRS